MNEQLNLRLSTKLLKDARAHAHKNGFSSVQEFIAQALRERLYDDYVLTPKEDELVRLYWENRDNPKLWASERRYQTIMKKKREDLALKRQIGKLPIISTSSS